MLVPGHSVSTERALELAIEAGAEDVQETEDEEGQPLLQVYGLCLTVQTHRDMLFFVCVCGGGVSHYFLTFYGLNNE